MDEEREAELIAKLLDADPPGQVVPSPSAPELTINQLAAIAREIAINVREIPDILAKYDITAGQFSTHVYPNGYFQQLLKSYAAEWESITSTNKRLAFQAGAALEETLPAIALRMGSTREDLADVIGAAKFFTQLAGAGAGPGGTPAESGQRFSIQINIGDRTVSLEASPNAPGQLEEHPVETELRALPEGPRAALPAQSTADPEGARTSVETVPARD